MGHNHWVTVNQSKYYEYYVDEAEMRSIVTVSNIFA